MRSLVALLALSLSGCLLFSDGGGKSCDLPLAEEADAIAPLRNPQTLTCDSFGGTCNPECGPCPAEPQGPRNEDVAALAPIPSWGSCGSFCDTLGEGSCASDPACRVVKDIHCAIGGNCLTDFLGCFPTDQNIDQLVSCLDARDGETCSRNPGCTAFHRQGSALRTSPQQVQEFVVCMPEGRSPGRCFDVAGCDAAPPECPVGTVAGVENSCWSGACIPEDLCEVPPPEPF
jgi:hypothetical protein